MTPTVLAFSWGPLADSSNPNPNISPPSPFPFLKCVARYTTWSHPRDGDFCKADMGSGPRSGPSHDEKEKKATCQVPGEDGEPSFSDTRASYWWDIVFRKPQPISPAQNPVGLRWNICTPRDPGTAGRHTPTALVKPVHSPSARHARLTVANLQSLDRSQYEKN